MFSNSTIYTACLYVSIEELSACSPLPFSFSRWLPPSLHVGSSLRLHFSCLGSLLSTPANKSTANLLPESLCPCSDCSSPPLLGNAPAQRRGWERAGASERESKREEGWARWKRYQMAIRWAETTGFSLSECVPENWRVPHAPSFPLGANRALLWGWRGDVWKEVENKEKLFNRPLLGVHTSCLRADCWEL